MNTEVKLNLDTVLADFSMDVVYVPSKYDSESRGLQYVVTVFYKEKLLATSNYSMGLGHIPGWNLLGYRGVVSLRDEQMINTILAKGGGEIIKINKLTHLAPHHKLIRPTLKDVLHSLVMDGDAINHTGFESWAREFDYDTDSRKAEATYRACLDIGLRMRNVLGQLKFEELREAFQDY